MSETTVFGPGYAALYDHFYADKDYAAECDFVEEVFRRYAAQPVRTVLDLGCGTGGHALILARRGYRVTGVDRSADMLAQALSKAAALSSDQAPAFQQSDIRGLDLGQTFDAVLSMFAVLSYMTTNDDLAEALRAARRHLQPGGLLVFDAWYGPAVLVQRPGDRFRVVGDGSRRAIRFVRSEMDTLRHVVHVHYTVLDLEGDRVARQVAETHTMRYLFPQEMAFHLAQAGFELIALAPCWRLDAVPTENDWNVAIAARAV
ncbi:MAG: class I SAM-dependent methyltransferase [Caldilineales bacterium]|nr:class I SAM-dependent methyltransferase [Caldilineales bacterium]